MIRRLLPIVAIVAVVVVIVLLATGGGSNNSYVVRAMFDNGAYLVTGEQVRVAGANVGGIKEVGVTMPGDVVAYKNGKPVTKPGKAVIELEITDPSFQDFRQDATCQIRPQSLIGEKFVDCRPTMPRAPGSEAPPPLKEIPEGETGAGQYLLPLGSNGTSVDPDLINNIQTLPYQQRFRLIFNELGAGFAGRGADLEVLVKRANPLLRDVDKLFGILSDQREELAQLASDSAEILGPLSRERRAVAGFISNSGAAAEASAERGEQLEESLRKFPVFLREFRTTMTNLEGFSEAATPVLRDFETAAPSLTEATRTLTPFSEATTVALKSLGAAGEAAGPIFAEADPIIRKTTELSKSGVKPTNELAKATTSLQKTGGWSGLVELIYNSSGAFNGFDQYGHFGRTYVTLSNCLNYVSGNQGGSGCVSRFNGPEARNPNAGASSLLELLKKELADESAGGTGAPFGSSAGPATGLGPGDATEPEPEIGSSSQAAAGTEPLLDYLLGP
jgi:phospholipid/cholesterol/gamma-HCH transport system substrate-binding protein